MRGVQSVTESCVVLDRKEFKRIVREAFLRGMAIALMVGLFLGYAWAFHHFG